MQVFSQATHPTHPTAQASVRPEREVTAELTAARAAYHEAAGKEPAAKLAERSAHVRKLMAELLACLGDGAKPCECGKHPHGMLARAAGREPAVYEVGCLSCPRRSRASSSKGAVLLWNAGEFYMKPKE